VNPWEALINAIGGVLQFFHDGLEGAFGNNAWGLAIILLTIAVRIVLLPLAVKQTRSQRAMQVLQPQMKKIQEKYKADKGLMRSDPEKYRELRAKQQEAMMGLYKEHGVNPASGCLPLLLQMPIFFALFRVLQPSGGLITETSRASFFVFHDLTLRVPDAGVAGWFLVVLMAGSTYLSSRQMMASTAASGQAAQQQKIMMYAMPLMLAVFSFQMFVGVLLYWVTTNIWTIGQQYVMFRSATSATPAKAAAVVAEKSAPAPGKSTPTPPKTAKTAKTAKPVAKASKPDTAPKKPKKATE
jgi:YidC/Oxa1 family membrane protein insertase